MSDHIETSLTDNQSEFHYAITMNLPRSRLIPDLHKLMVQINELDKRATGNTDGIFSAYVNEELFYAKLVKVHLPNLFEKLIDRTPRSVAVSEFSRDFNDVVIPIEQILNIGSCHIEEYQQLMIAIGTFYSRIFYPYLKLFQSTGFAYDEINITGDIGDHHTEFKFELVMIYSNITVSDQVEITSKFESKSRDIRSATLDELRW